MEFYHNREWCIPFLWFNQHHKSTRRLLCIYRSRRTHRSGQLRLMNEDSFQFSCCCCCCFVVWFQRENYSCLHNGCTYISVWITRTYYGEVRPKYGLRHILARGWIYNNTTATMCVCVLCVCVLYYTSAKKDERHQFDPDCIGNKFWREKRARSSCCRIPSRLAHAATIL